MIQIHSTNVDNKVYIFVNIYVYIDIMSVTISIRIEEELRDSIEDMGFTPGEYLKMILIKELKKERARRTTDWLKKNRLEGHAKSSEDLIREDRDR